ncbi:MAG: hypothetical protein KA436_09970 [Oligoflexales bacterium]|nr:hypothetical protein [Oligoflexales bacterium]
MNRFIQLSFWLCLLICLSCKSSSLKKPEKPETARNQETKSKVKKDLPNKPDEEPASNEEQKTEDKSIFPLLLPKEVLENPNQVQKSSYSSQDIEKMKNSGEFQLALVTTDFAVDHPLAKYQKDRLLALLIPKKYLGHLNLEKNSGKSEDEGFQLVKGPALEFQARSFEREYRIREIDGIEFLQDRVLKNKWSEKIRQDQAQAAALRPLEQWGVLHPREFNSRGAQAARTEDDSLLRKDTVRYEVRVNGQVLKKPTAKGDADAENNFLNQVIDRIYGLMPATLRKSISETKLKSRIKLAMMSTTQALEEESSSISFFELILKSFVPIARANDVASSFVNYKIKGNKLEIESKKIMGTFHYKSQENPGYPLYSRRFLSVDLSTGEFSKETVELSIKPQHNLKALVGITLAATTAIAVAAVAVAVPLLMLKKQDKPSTTLTATNTTTTETATSTSTKAKTETSPSQVGIAVIVSPGAEGFIFTLDQFSGLSLMLKEGSYEALCFGCSQEDMKNNDTF